MANPYLQIEAGAEAKRYELELGTDDVVLGRSTECHWVVSSGAVSRRHARIRRLSGQITIEDLGSSNGTFVNGERLEAPKTLQDKDSVRFGSVEAQFFVPKPTPESDATVSMSELQATMLAKDAQPATRMVPPPRAPEAAPPAAAPQRREHTGSATTATPPTIGMRTTAMPTQVEPVSSETAFRPAPAQPPAAAATSAAAPGGPSPSLVELAVIAAVSFGVVFAIGAALIRYVF